MKPVGLILDGDRLPDIVCLAKEAESAGFDSVWATELYRTSFQQLAAVAAETRNIKLGTAVALAFVRSPLITSLTALDLDEVSRGRLILGLGSGAKRTNELWHGLAHGKPVTRIKECIEVIRRVISASHLEDPISFEGEYYDINTRGYHRAFKPERDNVPIYLAGVGAAMTQAAGEVADGYIGHVVCSLRYLREVVTKSLDRGLNSSYKDRNNFTTASIITCAVSKDIKRAKEAARATIAFYSTVRTYGPPFKLHGFEKETVKIREAFFNRDVKGMIKNVSDDMVDTFAIVGAPGECRKRVKEYMEVLDLPILSAPHYYLDFEEVREYQKAILDTFST
jgi:probable F420-dependent oxidoreductase